MIDLTERQIKMEKMFSKNQLIPRIRQEFIDCDDFSFTEYIKQCQIPEAFGLDLLVQMSLHKRASLQVLVGVLRHHFEDSQLTVDMIDRATDADLVDYCMQMRTFIVKFNISEETQAELDLYQYPMPMIVEPMPVGNNREVGYITGKGSIILKNNHHDEDVCLDHINRMNKIPLKLNNHTAAMVQNTWRDLDRAKDGESREDFEKRKRAFEKYDRTAKDVMAILPDEFYLTHKYDKRGRTYCQGYHITYQGAPWNKAVVEFAEQEITE